jgi:peroxiredoxin Q/BCP
MRLEAGDVAVPFTAQAIDGTAVSLNQFAGSPVLLMFFRYASCPMCNLHLRDFAKDYGGLRDRGLAVVAFFHSPARAIQAHAGGRRYPFPLVSDPDFRVYRKYGVETSWPRLLLSIVSPRFYVSFVRSLLHGFWGGMAWQMAKMPADFLVGPDGRIVAANYGRDIGDHLPVARLHALLDAL